MQALLDEPPGSQDSKEGLSMLASRSSEAHRHNQAKRRGESSPQDFAPHAFPAHRDKDMACSSMGYPTALGAGTNMVVSNA